MSKLKIPIICIVIGEGSSGGALALGVGDKILMLENAVYSILSPEGFASILYKDASKNKEAAEIMKITAKDLKEFDVIDEIIKENDLDSKKYEENLYKSVKNKIIKNLKELESKDVDTLLDERYNKFRKIGKVDENVIKK